MKTFADPKVGKTSEDAESYGSWSYYNSCISFAEDTIEAGGEKLSSQLSPLPSSRTKWLQVESDDAFSYDPKNRELRGYEEPPVR